MADSDTSSDGPTLNRLIAGIHELMGEEHDPPTLDEVAAACDTLYAASLLKEEGRPVRARVIFVPPAALFPQGELMEDVHVLRFGTSHPFSANEIKRLSPAASFYHSAIAIWPVRGRGFRIWGILNTGPSWMNLVAGGRKSKGNNLPYPLVHVRDPGWLLFYHSYQLLAEWRGRLLHGPRIDVFQSALLIERFAHLRIRMIEEIRKESLPVTLDAAAYAELSHLIALQFIKRVINLIRTSGHGGSMVILPEGQPGVDVATRWIDCKYSVEADRANLRFRHLLQAIISRVGHLSPPGSSAAEAWKVFRDTRDADLDELEEQFFEFARFFSDLMQVDGALVVDQRLGIIGFGGEIRVDRNVFQVGRAKDLEGKEVDVWNVQSDGTRHRSVYRLCSVEPEVIGFVISQDSQVRLIANIDNSVLFWVHTMT